jgi:tight adherence protein C
VVIAAPPGIAAGWPAVDATSAVAALALLAVAAAAGLLGLVAVAAGRQVAALEWVRFSTSRIPAWIRALQPLLELVAAQLGPRLPPALRARVYVALRAAEVEEELLPQQFVALAGLHLVFGVALAWMLWRYSALGLIVGLGVALMPWAWLRDARRRRDWEILRDLSVYVDMLTLALEAGGALSVALRVATERMPDSALRRAFHRVQNDLRAGRSRADALRALAQRVDSPSVTSLVAALVQAETSGGSLTGVLRSQSEQRLNERFARAEKLALEAPVKLLAPLILCIFPCTFLVLAFPVMVRLLEG